MNKNLKILFIALLALAVATPAMAATFAFHGDLDNRFNVYTDQISWFGNDSGSQTLDEHDRPDSFATIKYRMWTEMSTNDGAVKGVYAIEVGGIRFGQTTPMASGAGVTSGANYRGGGWSGDGVNAETRWAYVDFQLPSVDSKARFRIGLQGHSVNKFFWAETAMGVKFYTDNWYVAWMRGVDSQTSTNAGEAEDWLDGDVDTFTVRYDLKAEPVKAGFWVAYLLGRTSDTSVDFTTFNALRSYEFKALPEANKDLLAFGVDGSWSTATNQGKLFINWDAIYELGTVEDVTVSGSSPADVDINAFLIHGDIGLSFGQSTLTFTSYYASGDDESDSDTDSDAFMQVDVDANYSIIFQEGVATNDDYFTERHVIGDKGMFLNKLDYNYKLSKKTKIGAAVLYLLTAEDIEWTGVTQDYKDDQLGIEFQLYASHMLYENLQLAWNFAYLASGDAMDQFEADDIRNGSSDVDIFTSTARIRYKF